MNTKITEGLKIIKDKKYVCNMTNIIRDEFINSIKLTKDNDQILFDIGIRDVLLKYFDGKELEWLISNNLLYAPAAKGHHSNYYGGLFLHSVVTGLELYELSELNKLKWKSEKSPMRIGLLHDICKTDDYTFNDDGTINYNGNKIYPGHGDKSIIMLAGNVNINEQEKICIRYHMGAFTDKEEWKYYSKACHDEPNVLYTHTADMISSQILQI